MKTTKRSQNSQNAISILSNVVAKFAILSTCFYWIFYPRERLHNKSVVFSLSKFGFLALGLMSWLSFLIPQMSYACPDIDGLVDINCDQQLVVVCFGDSITFGRGDSPEEIGYPGRLQVVFPNSIILNLGKPGEDTVRGRSRAVSQLNALGLIDYTIILEGVNDYFLEDASQSETRTNLLNIVQTAQNLGSVTLLSKLTAIRRDNQVDWVRTVNSLISIHTQIDFFALGTGIIGPDLIHPNATGYDQMTVLAAAELLEISELNRSVDTDGDGAYDFFETLNGSDPNDTDSDDDGLSDGDEYFVHGSSPILLDSDGDGLTDADEVNNIGSDPGDPNPGAPTILSIEVVSP